MKGEKAVNLLGQKNNGLRYSLNNFLLKYYSLNAELKRVVKFLLRNNPEIELNKNAPF